MLKTSLILLFTLSLTACSVSDSSRKAPNAEGPQGATCKLEGNWSRCSSYGGSSTLVSINATATRISETIANYNSVDNCQGAADSSFDFEADYVLGVIGASNAIAGATDADLTPNVDLFGCGAGVTAYTLVKFNEDCSEFAPTTTGPSCDANDRGSAMDPQVFVRQ